MMTKGNFLQGLNSVGDSHGSHDFSILRPSLSQLGFLPGHLVKWTGLPLTLSSVLTAPAPTTAKFMGPKYQIS